MERAGVLLPLEHTVSRELVGGNPEVFSPETERVHLAAGAFGYTGGSAGQWSGKYHVGQSIQ